MRASGNDVTQHKSAIQKEDMTKIRDNLKLNTPQGLQDKVFIDIVLQFARRGREGLRELIKDSISIKTDAAGRLYATPAYNELHKNYNGQDPKVHGPKKVLYEQDGDANCPVKSLQLYLSKLNPNCEAFFQRPKSKYTPDGIWYEKAPVGKNLLSAKMSKVSTEAGCSEQFTNHCLRATATTLLSHAGFDGNDICAVTGHRSVDSLRNYVTGPSMDQRNKMSTALHNYGSSSTDVTEQADCSSENAVAASTSSQAVTHTMPSVISEHVTVPQSLSVYTNQNSQTAVKSLLFGNNFYGTVNFYMNNQS